MTSPAEFASNFVPNDAPVELVKLLDFQENVSGFEAYSDGFGLLVDDKGGLKSWSEDTQFLSQLLPFAQANGTGSFYALWNDGNSKDSGSFPVIVFGDEGGVHVVAENVRGLLQIIAFDAEPMVDFDEVVYYKNTDDYEPRDGHDDYENWLSKVAGLKPVEHPSLVVAAAQAKHKAAFDGWFKKFVKS